ncbi:MAG: beta-mannosidase [Verrucomicrobiota bacterium]
MTHLTLNGQWTLQKAGDGNDIPASVPGDVYRDLLEAGAIPDPFFRDNENELQWIGESDWVYSRTFNVQAELLEHDAVRLACEGLDTFATISINGRRLARTDNMFRAWEWDVKNILKPGENTIQVFFESTFPYIRKQDAEQPIFNGGARNPKLKAANHGWVRKEQCNYGWDWGIKAVTCGIWRSIGLAAFNTARITDLHIQQDHSEPETVNLNITVDTECFTGQPLQASATVRKSEFDIATETATVKDGGGTITLRIENPELWWPNGLGEQPLYELNVELRNGNTLLDSARRRIGLRTLRLDRHDDQWGESFQFVVNGVPFFAKGANWIPADGILSRMTPDRYRQLVADTAAANMNMLRVWGGGIYEDDSFYEACDEHGICIWQDFMFACSAYPTFDEDFLESVKHEARDNVRRLRHHCCLALWCGNNELEQMNLPSDEGWGAERMPWDEYIRLFDHLLGGIVAELNPEVDYWPSSPHSPRGDRTDHNNPKWGDAHLWDVWHRKQPFEWYRSCTHRFNSEFGFQSFPEPKTAATYTIPADRNITTWVMEHHQRSGIGNTTIMQYMCDWFRLPVGFENTLWTSQILQGMAIKYACEHWRRSMPRGMGTLYWQLNDTWQVASWSSIDYFGRWKALHYMARHFFAPLLVSGLENPENGTVEIHVTNDCRNQTEGTVKWTVTDLKGNVILENSTGFNQPAGSSAAATTADLNELLNTHTPRGLLVWLDLEVGGQSVANNLVLFARPKHLELERRPGISAEIRETENDTFSVSLNATSPALWTWLEVEDADARFSDNFVHLRPGMPRTITVIPAEPLTKNQLEQRLKIRSLVDTYIES